MRKLDVKQGSPEWIQARLGIPTASCFDKIITPKTLKASASQDKYMARLLAEHLFGPQEDFTSDAMARGTEMEDEAASFYATVYDRDIDRVGFCIRDDGKVGASPDSLVDNDGVLEIKCPLAPTHILYMMNRDELRDAYWCQVQGECWITGRKWVDLISYHPSLDHVCVRVERDEKFIAALATCVDDFVKRLDEAKEKMTPKSSNDIGDDDPFATDEEQAGLQAALKGHK